MGRTLIIFLCFKIGMILGLIISMWLSADVIYLKNNFVGIMTCTAIILAYMKYMYTIYRNNMWSNDNISKDFYIKGE